MLDRVEEIRYEWTFLIYRMLEAYTLCRPHRNAFTIYELTTYLHAYRCFVKELISWFSSKILIYFLKDNWKSGK